MCIISEVILLSVWSYINDNCTCDNELDEWLQMINDYQTIGRIVWHVKFNLSYKYWCWINLVRVLNKVQNPRFVWERIVASLDCGNKFFRNFHFGNFKFSYILALMVEITQTSATIEPVFSLSALIYDHTLNKMTSLMIHICHIQIALFSGWHFFLRGLFVAVIGEMQSNKLHLAETALIFFFFCQLFL